MPDGDGEFARAEQLIELGRYAEAEHLLAVVLAGEPGSVRAWCLRCVCLGGLGEHSGAVAAAGQALALDPECEWAHRLRGLALAATWAVLAVPTLRGMPPALRRYLPRLFRRRPSFGFCALTACLGAVGGLLGLLLPAEGAAVIAIGLGWLAVWPGLFTSTFLAWGLRYAARG